MAPNTKKSKGRKRMFLGLHRISSSPSLAKMRPYKSSSRASMSCVSLHSSYDPMSSSSLNSELSQQFSTAPTSAANSPGPATPTFDLRPRARTLERNLSSNVGLPFGVHPVSPGLSEGTIAEEDYFSCAGTADEVQDLPRRKNFNFWNDMPSEIRIQVLSFLTPREVVRSSRVSKIWYDFCFDGQLWSRLDASEYYRDIPADALVKIISNAGPFVRDLNLRGCVQLREKWTLKGLIEACGNLENFSLEGCLIDRASVHSFLLQNSRLVHINVSGLPAVTNAALKIIGQNCPKLELLNVTWCQNVDTRGIRKVVEGCPNLKDLRAGEVRGWDDVAFCLELFERNSLERLALTNCDAFTDQALSALIVGVNGEKDWDTGRIICPPRKFKHLDFTRCRQLTDASIQLLAHNIPDLEGLHLAKCNQPNTLPATWITDASLTKILPTFPRLTHLDLEELENITNATLSAIATSPAANILKHLSISYCEALTDAGMVPLIRACRHLERIDMDNTRISDLCLIEAAAAVRERNRQAAKKVVGKRGVAQDVHIGLRMVVYDCPNVTWMGVREVLSRNAEVIRPPSHILLNPASASFSSTNIADSPTYCHEVISLKAFYTWQPTINEHSKRVHACDFDRARRLERKWAEFMMLGEEASQGGRRRRRRMREALEAMHGEEGVVDANGVAVRRRRARSSPLNGGNSCTVM
ncbi:RNI-like protein [Microthyrium microscopicum]|uniref:RNI-like protein n=1 Tax=Microthyrium microscopicum TaxID=703497 RepID=A0A6A6U822_9PEZI|nr:RNI-like protein [Microthyrium microscopicum]